ncbi:LysM peptidoglycan-binding domain-containing protein, partial [Paenibacillus sp. SC116]|nr:LysM peptidoglycan-binding domain-containing protein [Paenibacillus sp. SC116]
MWHIVQPGDSLSRISHRFNVPVEALVEANQIHNGTIYIGQQLFIPPDARVRLTYTVKPGDTLDSIARQFGTTKQAIMQANGLDSDFVVPGRVL